MSMKIIKPMTLGILHKPYCWRKQHYLSIAALGFFRLGTSDKRFLTENLQWPIIMKALPSGQMLDAAMPKAHCEVLVAGNACAPKGTMLTQMPVSICFGEVQKALQVYGNRQWLYGLLPLYKITNPEPFSKIPLGFESAYGGKDYPNNPVGKGYVGKRLLAFKGQNLGMMPNIEYHHQPVKNNHHHYQPASFGPLDIRWPQRHQYTGTYDQKWMNNDYPGLPKDFNFSAFNMASNDQWLTKPLKGGEAYTIKGMHPDKASISGEIPNYIAKAWVQKHGSEIDQAEQISLKPETVWFFPEQELGVLIYRGQCQVSDSDALDVASLTIAYEAANEQGKSLQHYYDVIEKRTNIKTAMQHVFNESQLAPAKSDAELAAAEVKKQQIQAKKRQQQQANLEEMVNDAWDSHGGKPAGVKTPVLQKPIFDPISEEEIASGDFDLSGLVEKSNALVTTTKAKMKQQEQQLEAKKQALSKKLPASIIEDAAEKTAKQLEDTIKKASKPAIDLVGGNPEDDEEIAKLLESLTQAESHGEDLSQHRQTIIENLVKAPAMKRQERRAAITALKDNQKLIPEVAKQLGKKIQDWIKKGESLVGRDFAGVDLSGLNLAGVDFSEVMLEGANLKGACLKGAILYKAVLTGADLEQADLSRADLSEANLCHANLQKAVLVDTKLTKTTMLSAKLANANLSGADLSHCIALNSETDNTCFDNTTLTQAKFINAKGINTSWKESTLEMTLFSNAQLEKANFTEAVLKKCVMTGANLSKASFYNSKMESVVADKLANFSGCDFQKINANNCGFRGTNMQDSNLSTAHFTKCDFGMVNFKHANLSSGVFYRSIFMQAQFNNANLSHADLFQALCRKADFSDADLRGANLVQAEMNEVVLENTKVNHQQKRDRRAA